MSLADTARLATLTNRERQVLRALGTGVPDKEIAAGLGTSVHTVKGYIRRIYDKLGAHNRIEALRAAGMLVNEPARRGRHE